MSKRVIVGALAGLAVLAALIVMWRSGGSGSSAPNPTSPGAGAASDVDRPGYVGRGNAAAQLRDSLAGSGKEFDALDPQRNAILIPVTGAVLDLGTGKPVAGADIIFKARGRAGEATAASSGDGTYATTLAPGLYQVTGVSADHYGLPGTLRLTNRLREARHDVRVIGTAAVRGRVVDGTGAALADARVTFRSRFHGNKIGSKHVSDYSPAASTATTGTDGAFELQVVPGVVLLEAEHGGATARSRIEAAAPGQTYEVRIVLDASAHVTGVVVSADGTPVGGATVRVAIRDDIKELARRSTRAGDDGRFRLDALTPGRAQIDAHATGVGTSAAVHERIDSGAAVEVRLVIEDETALAGTVVDSVGQGVAGARVKCRKEAASKLPPVVSTTDDRGAFECAVSAGPHTVTATHADYGQAVMTGAEAPNRELRLEFTPPGGVRGTVRTSDGAPVESFSIQALQATLADGTSRQLRAPPTQFRDDKGAFELPLGAPGSYQLVAITAGEARSQPVVVQVPSAGYAEANFVLEAGGTLEGLVRNGDGKPVEGASVELTSGYAGAPVFTDAGGKFAVRNVAAGLRSVMVRHGDYLTTTSEPVAVRSNASTPIAIELAPAIESRYERVAYVGIGAAVAHGGGIRIVRLVKRGPATRGGLRPGDVILRVDGTDVRTLPLTSGVERLRGAPGTSVTLQIQRGDDTIEVTLERRALRSREYPGLILA